MPSAFRIIAPTPIIAKAEKLMFADGKRFLSPAADVRKLMIDSFMVDFLSIFANVTFFSSLKRSWNRVEVSTNCRWNTKGALAAWGFGIGGMWQLCGANSWREVVVV